MTEQRAAYVELHCHSLRWLARDSLPNTLVGSRVVKILDDQCLFPGSKLGGQQDKQCTVASCECRALHLSLQHNELLTAEHGLQYQFRLAACQVQVSIQGQIMAVWLCPLAETLLDSLADGVSASH